MADGGLRALGPDLWCFERVLSLPGGVPFPARSTAVRLADGGLWLHAPLAIDDALAAALDALGPVRHIAAPNAFHHLFLDACRRRYPQAQLAVAPALLARRPELRPDATLADPPHPDWAGQLVPHAIEGAPRMGEYAFLHPASRTLLLADFAFHLREPLPARLRWVTRLMGVHDQLAPSRAWSLLARDRTALRESARRLLALDFERLVPAHGDVIERGARAALAAGLARRRLYREL